MEKQPVAKNDIYDCYIKNAQSIAQKMITNDSIMEIEADWLIRLKKNEQSLENQPVQKHLGTCYLIIYDVQYIFCKMPSI